MAGRKSAVFVKHGECGDRPRESEREVAEQACKDGYFVLTRGWPDLCLVRLKKEYRSGVSAEAFEARMVEEVQFVEVKKRRSDLGRHQTVILEILRGITHGSVKVRVQIA